MAVPMTADQMVSVLRAEGVRVVEVRNWRTHNRNRQGLWGPVHGVMIHHTVTEGTEASVRLCYEGHSTLPGPLCLGVVAKDGTVYLVGHGRANHAGGGDPDVLAAVITESYGQRPPSPTEHQGSVGATDGNAHFYGLECVNLGDGADPWPDAQIEAVERASAAICRAHGWTQKSVIGHKEWSDWKVDPLGVTMVTLRDRIAARIRATPGGKEDDMPMYIGLGTTWLDVPGGAWDAVEWHNEFTDQPDDHVHGGRVVLHGPAQYTGSVGVRVRDMPAGAQLRLVVNEVELGTGEGLRDLSTVAEVVARGGVDHGVIPLDGRLSQGRGMRIRVRHDHSLVRMKAYLRLHVWK